MLYQFILVYLIGALVSFWARSVSNCDDIQLIVIKTLFWPLMLVKFLIEGIIRVVKEG